MIRVRLGLGIGLEFGLWVRVSFRVMVKLWKGLELGLV